MSLKCRKYKFFISDQNRVGTLIGKDALNNEYYENKEDQSNRGRWIVYNKYNWDASQIPPEWHQWVHRVSDDAPSHVDLPVNKLFTPSHVEFLSGTPSAYKPYNTTKPKIEAFNGKPAERI